MTDTEKELLCPACKEKMKKLFLKDNKINVDICINGCGGIFFDNRELEKLDEPHENADEILNEIKNKTFKEVDGSLQRICPVCGTTMMKMGAANGNVEIDVCATCGGKFLDAGELQEIRNSSNETADTAAGVLLEQICQQSIKDIKENYKIVDKIPDIWGHEARKEFFIKMASEYIKKGK